MKALKRVGPGRRLVEVAVGCFLLTVASALEESGRAADGSAASGDSLESLEGVRSRIRIGAEIFLDPGHTRDEIRKHFARMRELGLSVARMFIIWDHVERRPGQWRFDLYDQAYDAAAANGIRVLTTLCPEDPPGWRRQTPFYHGKLTLNTPELCRQAGDYLQHVVTRYKDHPAQGPWSLANEPAGLAEQFDEPTMRQFGQWLRRRYGDVTGLNRRWFRPFESFESVRIGPEAVTGGHWIDYAAAVDWKRFRIQQQTDQLAWVRDQVRRFDTKHPTHVNPSALAYNMPGWGADAWSEKRVVDFLGTTIHPSWQVSCYKPGDTDLGIALITDLLRSASGGAPWWVTEMQSGPSLFGDRPFSPTPDQMTRWLWDDIGAGAKGVIFWCWHPRRFGREGGEWGLVNADASPTPRAEAVGRLSRALAGPAAPLDRATPLAARVAILYSQQSLVLISVDERSASGGDRVLLSLLGCHRALVERQIPVDFLDGDGLKSGAAARYAVLYLPHAYALDDASLAALRRYVAAGGTVWADGPLAWKDAYGNVRPEIPGRLADVFGLRVDDLRPVPGPFALTPRDTQAGEALLMPCALRGAQALATDAQGQVVAAQHRYGKGQAIYFGTALTLGYHRHPDPQAGRWIAEPARAQAQAMAVSAATTAPRVFFRGMSCPEGWAAILTNPGGEARVHVGFRGNFPEIEELLTARRIKAVVQEGTSQIALCIPAGGASILLARTRVAGNR
jgi:beta-galactosidase